MGLPYMGFKKTASQTFLRSCYPFPRLYEPPKETSRGQNSLSMPARQRSSFAANGPEQKLNLSFRKKPLAR